MSLMIALYDTIAGSLRRAAEAERSNNIEKRCQEVNHALMVIGFLEDRLAQGDHSILTQQLTWFYASLRLKLVAAQAKRSAELLEEQMTRVLEIRAQWQALDFPSESEPDGPEILAPVQAQRYAPPSVMQMEQMQSSWSA
jgi:flagellin-specific chaperone FliS